MGEQIQIAGAPANKGPIRIHRQVPAPPARKAQKKTFFRRPGVIVGITVIAIVGIVHAARVVFHSMTHQSTDDAFVDTHVVSVAPKIAGRVTAVHVRDNQLVKKGDVLIELDPRDLQVALAQAQANLAKDKATET